MKIAHKQRGFTLIEVVVAFAIFALSIGAVIDLFRSSIKRSQQSSAVLQQTLLAHSVLTQLRAQTGPWAESQSGITGDGMKWALIVMPYEVQLGAESAWRPVEVTITVQSAGRVKQVHALKSIELMYAPKTPS